MQEQTTLPQGGKSTFVTVVAWIFIVMAGFTTLISALQNIMINMMTLFDAMPASNRGVEQMPAFLQFMQNHVRLFFLSFFIISVTTLTAAIGLLRRWNWARLLFVAVLTFGIVWNLGGLVLQQYFLSSINTFQANNAPPDFRADFDSFTLVIRAVSIFFAVGCSAVFAWIIKRLLSGNIRAEFTQAP